MPVSCFRPLSSTGTPPKGIIDRILFTEGVSTIPSKNYPTLNPKLCRLAETSCTAKRTRQLRGESDVPVCLNPL